MEGTVGIGGANALDDVRQVQAALNKFVDQMGLARLGVDGRMGPMTDTAIRHFQRAQRMPEPNGLIVPGGRIAIALGLSGATRPEDAKVPLSGSAWWHANQTRWPNESKVTALKQPFQADVTKFIKALRDAGATVIVSATTRSMTRAQIMRYCWDVAKGLLAPDAVPDIPGVSINWVHESVAKSRSAAQEMVSLFAIKKQPSLNSNHLLGTAIDMTISWQGDLKIQQADTKTVTISTVPRNGTNAKLHEVGATYKVLHKLPDDPPHWSVTGR